MYISLNWLKDFIDIPKNITPEKLGEFLTLHTIEVEGIKTEGNNLDNIVVGKIEEIKKHSNADKLQLAIVSDGKKKYQIVCGGNNLFKGMLVVFAKVGSKVKWHGQGDLVEMQKAIIRGEESEGMICTAVEVGLENLFPTDDELEVVDLTNNGYKVGQNLAEALGLGDTIYDIDNKSMTHRPDLWSHYGVARDLAALMDVNLKEIITNKIKTEDKNKLDVKVEDKKLCPRYMAVAVENIEIKPSAELIQQRLITCGMRPINNIVDITNYIMLEMGQQTHAFDAKKLGNKIVIKKAIQSEKIVTLDGEERKLDNEILLITDGKNPVAIAGVMGGSNSEIDNSTTSVILESANFDAVSIRKTSQKLNLRTDASQRYEKSLDPNLCELAIKSILTLIKESCPNAEVVNNVIDVKNFKLNQNSIKLDLEWVKQKIGPSFAKATKGKERLVVDILKRLGFEVTTSPPTPLLNKERGAKKESLSVIAPSWRATKDISIPEDLVEEIARVYGYDNIKPEMPKVSMQAPEVNIERDFINKIKDILVSAGMNETYNYTFVNEEQLQKLQITSNKHIKIANPLTQDCTLLRQSLMPNLLQNVIANQRNYEEIKLFEVGNVFLNENGKLVKNNLSQEKIPAQPSKLGIICAGGNKNNFFILKGIIEYLLSKLNIEFEFKIIALDEKIAGNVGIKTNVVFCELDIEDLLAVYQKVGVRQYEAKNKFPALERDMAFVVNEKVLYNDIKKEILTVSKLIKKIVLFDIYQGEKLGVDNKSLAMHIIFLSTEKTLTGEEVDKIQLDITKALDKKFKAQLRDF